MDQEYWNKDIYFKAKDGSEHPNMEAVKQANQDWFRQMYPQKIETIINKK